MDTRKPLAWPRGLSYHRGRNYASPTVRLGGLFDGTGIPRGGKERTGCDGDGRAETVKMRGLRIWSSDLVQRVDKLKAEVGEERVKKELEGIIRELLELDMALEIPGQ